MDAELRRWMSEHGVSGRMPTKSELRSSSANSLHWSIGRLGGSTAFAQRLRLAPALRSCACAGGGERVAELRRLHWQSEVRRLEKLGFHYLRGAPGGALALIRSIQLSSSMLCGLRAHKHAVRLLLLHIRSCACARSGH